MATLATVMGPGAQANKRIRIVIADDYPLVRMGLRQVLEKEPDLIVIGEAANGAEAVERVRQLSPDILILDLGMPRVDGFGALDQLRKSGTQTKVIVLTGSEDKALFVRAMKLGCSGIVRKGSSAELLVKSIRKVTDGEIWLDSDTTAAVVRQFASAEPVEAAAPARTASLSKREIEIVALVAQGHSNKEIAEKLFISEQTVKNHLHNVFEKLGVTDRLQLALYAIHTGISPVHVGVSNGNRVSAK